jgi:predicted AlkP superfamily pyrophosphatase or phosphodiesterase
VDGVQREDLEIQLDPCAAGGVRPRDGERRGSLRRVGGHAGRVAKRCAALLLALWLPLAAAADAPAVILISWDGTRWDYPDRAPLPALERMARDGVRAERLIPVFPASTFPNHVALATGAHVDRHGIVSNRFEDTERGRYDYSNDASWIEAEPLWIAAERQGVRAASFFWVGSETDWRGIGATYRVAPFDDDTPESEKVDRILAWLDLPESERPRLIVSWWRGADSVGHRYGPDHPAVVEALVEQDAQLGRLLRGLDARDAWPRTTLLVVSDHGMAAVEREGAVAAPLRSRGIGARIVRGGGFGWVTLDDPSRLAEALEILAGVEGLSAWASADMRADLRAYHPRRTGHLTVVPEPPLAIAAPRGLGAWAYRAARRLVGGSSGQHGYPPDHPDMHAVLFALGRGVPRGLELGPVRAIDVAPTVTHLLGIDPPRDAEGRPIAGIGSRPARAPSPAAAP